jgi:hypothetical protein
MKKIILCYTDCTLPTVHTVHVNRYGTVSKLVEWSKDKFFVGRFLEVLTVNTPNQNNLVYRLLEGPSYISFTDSLNSVN